MSSSSVGLGVDRTAHLSTIIWRTEQRDQLSLGEELVSILHDLSAHLAFGQALAGMTHLVCSADQIHVVFLQEPRDDVRTERERDSSIVLTPSRDILVRVRPQEVT